MYRGFEGTHIYNKSTNQWVFINSDNNFNTGFKLSYDQMSNLLRRGIVR